MEQRMVDFIAALRAAGTRVSLAESADAFRAVEQMGVLDRELFRLALRTTLIKEAEDIPTFEQLFPLYFGSGGPPLTNPQEGMSPQEKEMLRRALQMLLQQMREQQRMNGEQNRNGRPLTPQELAQLAALLRMLMEGQNPSQEQMQQMGEQAGLQNARRFNQQNWQAQRMMRQMGMEQLRQLLQELFERLAQMGMSAEAVEQLREAIGQNEQALREQLNQFVGQSIARQLAENPPPKPGPELMERPFQSLSETEAAELRNQVRRLAAQLRSRAALRQKKGKKGTLDAKTTIRANLRYGSVPLELHFKQRHLKPKVVVICDISTSVRHCAEFMLRLIYELQDQVARTRSFAFIDHMEDISGPFEEHRPDKAVGIALDLLPPGSYNTDLGNSLDNFVHDHLDAVDRRTTVIFVGDGRNNYNNPRLDHFQAIKRRARRILWFNPEMMPYWGTGDSDIYEYLPLVDATHQVSNLAELTEAVERLFDYR